MIYLYLLYSILVKDIAEVLQSKNGAEALPPDYDIVDLNQKYNQLEKRIASLEESQNKSGTKVSNEKENVCLLAHSVDFQRFESTAPYRFKFKVILANEGYYSILSSLYLSGPKG